MAYSRKTTKRKVYKKKVSTAPSKKKIIKKALNKSKVNYIKRIVKSVVHKNVETKMEYLSLLQQVPINGGGLQTNQGNVSGQVIPQVVPALVQGTGANQRIGNKVKPQGITIKGYVNSLEYDAISNTNTRPFYAHIWLVMDKSIRQAYDMSGNAIYNTNPKDFMRRGNDPVPFDGSIGNALLPYNTRQYTVLQHRRIKLDSMSPTISYGTQPVNTVVQDSVNNGFGYCKPFKMTIRGKYLPKQFLYSEDDTGSSLNTQTNFNPQIYVALQNADGTLSSSTQKRFALTLESMLYYEDA